MSGTPEDRPGEQGEVAQTLGQAALQRRWRSM